MTRTAPVRTCIGCRNRTAAAELLRVVVAPDAVGRDAVLDRSVTGAVPVAAAVPIVPDPRRRMAGRGAYVHPVHSCVDLAQRRRAFARALRVSGPVDPAPVSEYVAGLHSADTNRRTTAGDENSMAQR